MTSVAAFVFIASAAIFFLPAVQPSSGVAVFPTIAGISGPKGARGVEVND